MDVRFAINISAAMLIIPSACLGSGCASAGHGGERKAVPKGRPYRIGNGAGAAGADAAQAASDIVLLGHDLSPVEDAVRIASRAVRRMKENFWLSAAYDVVSVPVALVGSATPLLAALVHVGQLREGDAERATVEVKWTC